MPLILLIVSIGLAFVPMWFFILVACIATVYVVIIASQLNCILEAFIAMVFVWIILYGLRYLIHHLQWVN